MKARRILLGLLLVAVGAAFFVERVGGTVEVASLIERWWPLGLVALGVANLFRFAEQRWALVAPILVAVMGSALLLFTLQLAEPEVYPILWPLALVVVGIAVAMAGADSGSKSLTAEPEIRRVVWLRGERIVSRADPFWRASLTVLFGALEVDLRDAVVHPTGAVINVNALFATVRVLNTSEQLAYIRRPFVLRTTGFETSHRPPGLAKDVKVTVNVLACFGDADAVHVVRASALGGQPRDESPSSPAS